MSDTSSTEAGIETVMVTGGAGLIGSAVIRQLLIRKVKVIAIDNFCIGEWRGSDEKLVWEKLDVCSPLLGEKIEKYNPDILVHCAAHPGGKSLSEPTADVRINSLGSMSLFESCARLKIPVIYLSSSVIYGDQPPGPILESAPLKPGTIYGACKVACETFLKILEKGYGLEWTILRLFATYGAGHSPNLHQGTVNIMLTQLLTGDRIIVKGSLERARDLLYVEDAAAAVVSSIFSSQTRGQVINVGTGIPITIRSLIEELCVLIGKRMEEIEIVEEEGIVGDPFFNSANISKAQSLLDYIPKWDLERGLSELIRLRMNIK